jgi:F0F1-type ATP synthase, epsilon subunit (mitochondrial delta subunit)
VRAAVSGGFLSVADDRVSILAAQARLAQEVDREEARRELDAALSETGAGPEEPSEAKYARALLRAAATTRLKVSVGGALALDAAWLFAAFLIILILAAVGIAARRFLLERGGGTVECGLRRGPNGSWRSAWRLPARGAELVRRPGADDAAGCGVPAPGPDWCPAACPPRPRRPAWVPA